MLLALDLRATSSTIVIADERFGHLDRLIWVMADRRIANGSWILELQPFQI